MCGIAGFISRFPLPDERCHGILERQNDLQRHRGPDGRGTWISPGRRAGLSHVRLSIIDLKTGGQPMGIESGNVIVFNGEIYNFIELRRELGEAQFHTTSDTEVILRAYEKWGEACVDRLRGMFAFALWDARAQKLFIGRDRFGIKPFYYLLEKDVFFFASEIKALLPFQASTRVSLDGLRDYFTFQFCLGSRTLFEGIQQLQPAHVGLVDRDLNLTLRKYWEVHYDLDWHHTERYFIERLRQEFFDSIEVHLRSDVEVGAYLSGGLDSSLVASVARDSRPNGRFQAFTGKFSLSDSFDESRYARVLTDSKGMTLHEIDVTERDFVEQMPKVIYHLDQPVAGPGSFPQYMVSKRVREHLKVVLGGQGGDEIFGGYTRYLIAYFEQCIKGAIDGTLHSGKFVVTYESIIPNLATLQNYKPLLQEFWAQGIFDSRDQRYFRLVNRSNTFGDIVDWSIFNGSSSFEDFKTIYWGKNVGQESYFDSMTHFDFKTLLPALLQVEDRMSMAHGIESRVPFLDHEVVELAATIPANIKFENGELKRLVKVAFADKIPPEILNRKDKMGFPVPLQVWMNRPGVVRDFILDLFRSARARQRFYLGKGFDVERLMRQEPRFGRNLWAFLSLELWQRQFFDEPVK
ncbi:MAG: asparagine synthase (glutamine-hydrolyzing) [Planctomycetes bacterium]|nr:asparagine synthase (glutamine-hydrolyzing) [Planctomycetota bacterium]